MKAPRISFPRPSFDLSQVPHSVWNARNQTGTFLDDMMDEVGITPMQIAQAQEQMVRGAYWSATNPIERMRGQGMAAGPSSMEFPWGGRGRKIDPGIVERHLRREALLGQIKRHPTHPGDKYRNMTPDELSDTEEMRHNLGTSLDEMKDRMTPEDLQRYEEGVADQERRSHIRDEDLDDAARDMASENKPSSAEELRRHWGEFLQKGAKDPYGKVPGGETIEDFFARMSGGKGRSFRDRVNHEAGSFGRAIDRENRSRIRAADRESQKKRLARAEKAHEARMSDYLDKQARLKEAGKLTRERRRRELGLRTPISERKGAMPAAIGSAVAMTGGMAYLTLKAKKKRDSSGDKLRRILERQRGGSR